MLHWILLAMAIATEIIGTVSMKWASINGNNSGYIIMLIMITLSYILLSFAVKRIALGVAYAMWESVGILFITFFSVLLFDGSLSAMKVSGLLMLIVGIYLVKSIPQEASPWQRLTGYT